LRNKAVGFQLADEAKDSMHLIDEAALSTSSEQQQNDKDAK
jgi:C4-dicarboxylate transporter DctQ subunit